MCNGYLSKSGSPSSEACTTTLPSTVKPWFKLRNLIFRHENLHEIILVKDVKEHEKYILQKSLEDFP